jgi:hypothetical protein
MVVRYPKLKSILPSVLILALVMLTGACTKASKSVSAAKDGSNFGSTVPELVGPFAPNKSISDAIRFIITTKEGRVLPGINVEFKAFDITAASQAGLEKTVIADAIRSKWNDPAFVMDSNGAILGTSCDAGTTRESCVGILSGASKTTNQLGEASVGFTTPNYPSGVIAIALRVQEDSTASQLLQFVTIRITSNEEFATSGIEKLDSSLIVIPSLFGPNGEQVLKAGVPFNLSLVIPGIPNTKSGQGFEFNFQIEGLGDISEDKGIVLPSGKLKCDFRNSQCVVPGGPFKVLKPGNVKISVSPPNSRFPVKPTSLELPITTGAATRMVLSLTPIETGINNACVAQGSADEPCLELSADEAERTLYPIIVDDAGNFVSKTSTSWSATGPLSGAKLKKGPTVVDDQILVPDVAGRGVLTVMSTTFPGISTAVTYAVRSGSPSAVVLRNENDGFERAGREFKVKVELYDKKNNLCIDYFRPVKLSLALENGAGININLPQSITSDVTPSTTIDQTTEPVLISAGLGITTKSFMIAKVDPNALDSELPAINLVSGEIDEVGKPPLVQREKTNFLVRQGDVTQTVLRMADLGRGNVWLDASNPCPLDDSVYCLRTDKNYYFYNAGYDRAGNFVQDVPSDFWGVNYNIADAYVNFAQTGSTPIQTLGALDPGDFAEQANCLNPNITPDPLLPANSPTNQPADGAVFCSIHRGLGVKSGSSTSYKAAGLAGTGRVLAIPKNRTIRAALSPRLKISGGTTSKFVIELRSVLNNVKLTPPVIAGEQFRIYIYARDDQNFTTVDFAGVKHFYLTRGGEPSWLGFKSKLPNGLVSCDFGGLNSQNYNEPGVCELPGIYYVSGSRLDDTSSIVIEQTAASGDGGSIGVSDVIIPGSYSITIPAIPGPEKRLVFSTFRSGVSVPNNELTKNGPPDNQSYKVEPLIPSSVLAKSYREIDADQEKGLGLVITDEMGNYIRDVDPVADGIDVEGFISPTDTLTGVFDETTGVWADPANKYTPSDVFKKTNESPDKFLYPSKPEHHEFISNPFFKTGAGKDLYSTIFIPQNRFGNGYAVAKSLTNPNLVGWPSPWMKVTPGKPDHIEMFPIADANATTPAGDLSTGQCYRVKMFIKDVRGNVVTDYSGSPYGVFKLFNASLKETLSYNTLAGFPATGIANKLYLDKSTSNYYYWDSGQYFATINPNSETESFYGFDEFPETGVPDKYFHDRLYDKFYFWNSDSAAYVETAPPEVDVNDKFALDFARFREAQDPKRRSGYYGFASTVTELLNFYDARNRADIPGPYSDGFNLDTNNEIAGGGPIGGTVGFGFEKTLDAPPKHHENWVARYLNVYQGEIRDLRDEGGVCFYTGQTRLTRQDALPSIQKYMQVDIEAFDLSQNGGRTFDAITSRGAGRTHKKDETVIYRSLAKTPVGYHGDMFTVRRGSADHLHAVYNDSWENPNLIPNVNNGNNALIMVTDSSNCPLGNFGLKCAGQQVYWHVHDWTHNYIRPAYAGTYTANAIKPYPYFDHYSSFPYASSISYCAPGSNKSPCTKILPPVNPSAVPPVPPESRYMGSAMTHRVWGLETRPADVSSYVWPANHAHLTAGNSSSVSPINTYYSPSQSYLGSPPGASFKRGVLFQFMPGPMWELKLSRNGPASLTVDDYFSFDASLLDMYGNVTGAGTWQRTYPFGPGYNISRKLHVWYEQDPVNNIDVPADSPSAEKSTLFNKLAKPTSVEAAKAAGTSYSMLAPTGWAWGTSLSLNPNLPAQQARLVKANQTVRIRARVEDDSIMPTSQNSGTGWCTGTKCKISAVEGVAQRQYVESSIDLTPLPGARTSVVIYDRGKGLEYTSDNFANIFQSTRPGDVFPIIPNSLRTIESYLCDKDQFGNMGLCSFSANWSLIDSTTADLVSGGVNPQTNAYEWSPRKPGQFKLRAERNGLSYTSDAIIIQGKPLDKFIVKQEPLATSATVAAGEAIPFLVCMADDLDNLITTEIRNSNNQVVTNPNGSLNVEFNSLLAGKNAEDQSIEFSSLSSFATKFTSGVQPVGFVDGCASLYARVLNAKDFNTPLFQLSYDDGMQLDSNNIPKRVAGNGVRVAKVTPLAAHHFVATPENTKAAAYGKQTQAWSQYGTSVQLASADGNVFDVRFEARDQYGNATNHTDLINVKLREADGTEITYNSSPWRPMCDNANGSQCLTGQFTNQSQILIENMALDIGGRPIYVTAQTSDGSIMTAIDRSIPVYPVTSAKTVASYSLDVSQALNVVAGQSFNVRISALDKAGQLVKGATQSLSDVDFEWFNVNQSGANYVFENLIELTHKSLDGQSPIVKRNNSTKIVFADGWADHPITLVKAETLRLNIREINRPDIKSNNQAATVVSPGSKVRYAINCQKDGSSCNGTGFANPATLAASPASKFSLTVDAFDQYKNQKQDGPLSPAIEIVQDVGDTSNVGFLEVHGQTAGTVSFDLNNKVTDTKTNLFRRSAGKVKYTISKASANWDSMYQEVYHSYTPDVEMVYKYVLSGVPQEPIAGQTYAATVTAIDIAGNPVKDLVTALSDLTFEWKGSSFTGSQGPDVTPAPKLTFNASGVANASVTFKKSENIADFFVKDTYPSAVSGTVTYASLPYRRSGNLLALNALSVRSANQPARFVLELVGGGNSVWAGAGFNVKVTALDALGNVVTDYGTTGENLKFTYTSGAESTDPTNNPKNTVALAPTPSTAPINSVFSEGVYTSAASNFKLYVAKKLPTDSNRSVTLKVEHASVPTITAGELVLTVSPSPVPGYVLMTSTAQYTGHASVFGTSPITMRTDQTRQIYGHLFDDYGNYLRTDPGIRWRGTGDFASSTHFSETPSASNVFSPQTIGTGAIIAECPTSAANCSPQQSAAITVNASALKSFSVEQTPAYSPGLTLTAGDIVDMKVCMRDVKNQIITLTTIGSTDPNGAVNLLFSPIALTPLNSVNSENNRFTLSTSKDNFEDSSYKFLPNNNRSLSFNAGCANFYVKILKSGSGAGWGALPQLQLTYDDNFQNTLITGKGLAVDAVNPRPLHHFATSVSRAGPGNRVYSKSNYGSGAASEYAETNPTGNLFDINVYPRDEFGNQIVPLAGTNVTLSLLDPTNPTQNLVFGGKTWKPICSSSNGSNVDCADKSFNGSENSKAWTFAALDITADKIIVRAKSGVIDSSVSYSDVLNVVNTHETVKGYTINNAPASLKAGETLAVQVSAKDNAGQNVRNAADSLSSVTFDWVDAAGNVLTTTDAHRALNPAKTPPIVSSSLQFNSSGQATSNVTLVRSETFNLNLQDRNRISTRSNTLQPTTVGVGDGMLFGLTCKMKANPATDCTGSAAPYTLAASPTDSFSFVLNAYDQYQNPKDNINIEPRVMLTKVAGNTTNPAGLLLEQNSGGSNTAEYLGQRVFAMNGVASRTFDNLFHRAGPHTIEYTIDPASVTQSGAMVSTVRHTYTTHPAMVYQYQLTRLTTPVLAGSPSNYKIEALDKSGNLVSDPAVDLHLNQRTFGWYGPTASGVSAPVYPLMAKTGGLQFSGGVINSAPITFKMAEDFLLFVFDDYVPDVAGIGGNHVNYARRSTNSYTSVSSSGATKLVLEPTTTTPIAGDEFNVKVVAKDANDNVVTSFTSANLTFAWNASSTQSNVVSAVQTPAKPSNGQKTFDAGRYTPAAGERFKLFYSNPTTLGAPQVVNLTVTATGVDGAGTASFTVQPRNEFAYVRMTENALYNTADDVPTSGTITMNTAMQKTYYGHLFDSYGNYRGLNSAVAWSGLGDLQNKFSATSGQSSTLSPTTAGTGTFAATCNAIASPIACQGHTSASVAVSASPLSYFRVSHKTGVAGAVAPNATVVAGTVIPLEVCMYDVSHQPITTDVTINTVLKTKATESNVPIQFSLTSNSITGTAEGQSIKFSKNADFSASFGVGNSSLDFTAGCAPLYARIDSVSIGIASDKFKIQYNDSRQGDIPITGKGLNIASVTVAPLHHYATTFSNHIGSTPSGAWTVRAFYNSTDQAYAKDGGYRFDLNVYARDQYGNAVLVDSQKTLNIGLLEENGNPISGKNIICADNVSTACRTVVLSQGESSTQVAKVGLDFGGRNVYIDANDGAISIKTGSSVGSHSYKIYAITSAKTVKDYVLSLPSQITAGVQVTASVTARDNYGDAIQNAEADLTTQNYKFLDETGSDIIGRIAPDGSVHVLGYTAGGSRTLPFANNGVASIPLTFKKTETSLQVRIRDAQATARESALVSTMINPGTVISYKVTCQKLNGSACNGSSAAAATTFDASPADTFNLTIQAYDQFRNVRQGESDAYLKPVRVSGSALNVGRIESTVSGSVQTNANKEILANTLTANGNVTLSSLFHRSGNHTITYEVYSANNPNPTILDPIYHTFNPHGDMVYSYNVTLGTLTPVAGTPVALTIQAKDIDGNNVTGLASYLNDNSRVFVWSGANAAPSGDVPEGPTTNLGFDNDGLSNSKTYTFKKAETIAKLTLTDQTNPTVPGIGGEGSGNRRIGSVSNITVSNAIAAKYVLDAPGGLMPKAGVPFTVNVSVKDTYDNLVKTNWVDTFKYRWDGAGSQTNPKTTALSNPVPDAETTVTNAAFGTSGVYPITGLTLFKSGQTPQFVVTGTNTSTASTAILSKTLDFGQSQPNDSASYVKITTDGSYSSGTELGITPQTVNAGIDYTYHAHLFDPYGNYKGQDSRTTWILQTVSAGATGTIGASGSSSKLTPTSTGKLTITAYCSFAAGCSSETSGEFTVLPGAISRLAWIVAPASINQTTDSCTELEVEAQDNKDNPVPVSGVTLITFTSSGGDGDFYDTLTACQNAQDKGLLQSPDTALFHVPNESSSTNVTGTPGTRSKSLVINTARTKVWYANRTPNASVSVAATFGNAATPSLTGAVTAGAARRFAIMPGVESGIYAAGSATGDTCAALPYKFQDRWLNDATPSSQSQIRISATNTVGSFYTSNNCGTGVLSFDGTHYIHSVDPGSPTATIYYRNSTATGVQLSLTTSSTISGQSALQGQSTAITVSPGTFDISSPATESDQKNPVSLAWSQAAGKSSYTLGYTLNQNCSTGVTNATGISGESFSLNNSSLNGAYYICLTAVGTATAPLSAPTTNANGFGVYKIKIDNTLPVVSGMTVASPGQTTQPTVTFTLSEAAKVTLYSNSLCTVAISSETAFSTDGAGKQVQTQALSTNTTSTIYARAIDSAGNLSACNTGTSFVAYRHDSVKPTLSSVSVPVTGSSRKPSVSFVVSEDTTTVNLFTTVDCSGSNIGSASFNTGATRTLAVNTDLAANAPTSLYARAVDQAGNISDSCYSAGTYTHDNIAPTILSVTSNTSDGYFKAGAVVSIQVTFSEAVTVSGTPTLTLNTTDSSGAAFNAVVNYATGSGSSVLNFNYTVASNQNSTDLDYVSTTALSAAGTIQDAALNNAVRTLPTTGSATSLGGSKEIVIDTKVPTVTLTSITPQTTNTSNVTPALVLNLSEPSKSDALKLFKAAGCSAGDQVYSGTGSAGNNSVTTSALATNATTTLYYTLTDLADNTVTCTSIATFRHDTVRPKVSYLTSSSSDQTYATGTIPVQVVFTENVTVTGTPTLTLATTDGSGAANNVTVNYTSGSGSNTLVFNYSIAAGQNSIDLNYLDVNSLVGVIKDTASNYLDDYTTGVTGYLPATGSTDSLAGRKSIVIDTKAPTITFNSISNGYLVSGTTYTGSPAKPTITGATNEAATVRLFYLSGCSGSAVGTQATTSGSLNFSITPSSDVPNAGGNNIIYATATDSAGNATSCTDIATYNRDTAAPDITSPSAGAVFVANSALTVTATVDGNTNDANNTYSWTASGATNSCTFSLANTNTRAVTVSVNADTCADRTYGGYGQVTLQLSATDRAQNTATRSVTVHWDEQQAFVSSVTAKTPKTYRYVATSPTEANGGVVLIDLTFSKASGNPRNGLFGLSVDTTNGSPTLPMNTGGVAIYDAVGSDLANRKMRFSYTVQSTDFTGQQMGLRLTLATSTSGITLNGSVIKDNSSSGNVARVGTGDLPNTTGGISNVKIDNVSPQVVFKTGSVPDLWSNGASLAVLACHSSSGEAECSPMAAKDVTTLKYYVALGTTCSSNKADYTGSATASSGTLSWTLTNVSTSGTNDVVVCAYGIDTAGNEQAVGASATSYTWKRDLDPPQNVTVNAPTDAARFTGVASINAAGGVQWSNINTNPGEVVDINLRLATDSACLSPVSGEDAWTGNNTSTSRLLQSATLADGLYYICMRTKDRAGNISAFAGRTFEIESDTIHVSFTENHSTVKYSQKVGVGDWIDPETVASGGGRSSLAVDKDGAAYVSFKYFDSGTDVSALRWRKRLGANSYGSENTVNSEVQSVMPGVGSFNELALGNQNVPSVYSVFFGYNSSGPNQGMSYAVNTGFNGVQVEGTNNGSFRDMAIAVGTDNTPYGLATVTNGSNFVLKIQNLALGNGGDVTLPTNCGDALFVSAVSKNSSNVISMALACRMSNDNTCRTFYGEATYNAGAFTYSTWTDVGLAPISPSTAPSNLTMKAATCSVSDLIEGDRPSIMYDRVNGKVSVAWVDKTNNKIYRWNNESGANRNDLVVTGSETLGQQTLGIDKTGKSYVVFLEGTALKSTSNNARPTGNWHGSWSIPAAIGSGSGATGIGTIGINGMKGRSNTQNGN